MTWIVLVLYVTGAICAYEAQIGWGKARWPAAIFFPLVVVFCFLAELSRTLWAERPKWRWRVTWVRKVSLKHFGWTTKEGKLCGLIKVDKRFGHGTEDDRRFASGLILPFNLGMIGTVTRPGWKK